MPGLQPDLGHALRNGDRVALFHLKSMWPFQYRHGVAAIPEMSDAMLSSKDQGLQPHVQGLARLVRHSSLSLQPAGKRPLHPLA